jgi:hypothetical protein
MPLNLKQNRLVRDIVRELTGLDPMESGGVRKDVRELLKLVDALRVNSISADTPMDQVPRGGPRSPRSYLTVLDDWGPNAVAASSEGLYVIGVHAGMVLATFEFFLALMACTEILPSIGDARGEIPRGFPSLSSFLDYSENRRWPRIIPRDRARVAAAMWFGDVGMLFGFFHELGHVFGGHLDYIREHTGSLVLKEFSTDRPAGVDRRLFQAFELDADRRAACSLLNWLADAKRPLRAAEAAANIAQTAPDRLRWFCFTLGCTFLLLNAFSEILLPTSQATHPNVRMRAVTSTFMASQYLQDKGLVTDAEATGAFGKACADMLKVCEVLGNVQSPLAAYTKEQGSQELVSIRQLTKLLDAVSSQLVQEEDA